MSYIYRPIALTFLSFGQLMCHIYMHSSTPQILLFLLLMDGRYTLPARNMAGWEWDPDPKHGGSQISIRTMQCVSLSIFTHHLVDRHILVLSYLSITFDRAHTNK